MIKKIGLLLVLLMSLLTFTSCRKNYDIRLTNWYDLKRGETLFTVKAKNYVWSCLYRYEFIMTIEQPKENVSEIVKETPFYIGEYQMKEGLVGDLLFANNNYYVLYASEEDFIICNLLLKVSADSLYCFIPFPNEYDFPAIYKEEDLEHIFDKYTYLDLKDFYARFDQYVALDDDQEMITIETKEELFEYDWEIQLNFKEKYLSIVEDQVEKKIYRFEV